MQGAKMGQTNQRNRNERVGQGPTSRGTRANVRFDQRAVHPKDGLFLYGPLDDRRPAEMRVGVIGTEMGIARYRRWLTSVQGYIAPLRSALFHEAFPGFEATFKTTWPLDPIAQIVVPDEELRIRIRLTDRHDALFQTVEAYSSRLAKHAREEEVRPAFWVVVIPEEIWLWGRQNRWFPRGREFRLTYHSRSGWQRRFLRLGAFLPKNLRQRSSIDTKRTSTTSLRRDFWRTGLSSRSSAKPP